MPDPKITKSSVVIKYHADDGYRAQIDYTNRGPQVCAPHQPLLDAYDELARLLALFGYEAEARAAAEERFKAVAEWSAARKENQNG